MATGLVAQDDTSRNYMCALYTNSKTNSAYLPQHQRRILRSKGDAIADCMFDFDAPSCFRDIIQVAVGIRLLQIDGRRNLSVMHGDQGGGNAGCAQAPWGCPICDFRLDIGVRRAFSPSANFSARVSMRSF